MSKHEFRITFSGCLTLNSYEIWPDGDAPPNPTARDVRNKMINTGGKADLLSDWNLEDDLGITIVDERGNSEEWEGL